MNLRNKLIPIGLAALLCTGCAASSTPGLQKASLSAKTSDTEASKDIFAMDTYMSVRAYGDKAETIVEEAEARIHQLDSLLSTGDDKSEIYRLNQTGSADLSEDAAVLVARSLELYDTTSGLFDIAIYPVMEAWGFTNQEFRVPDPEEVNRLLEESNVEKIAYDSSSGHVDFADNSVRIDLGGIAKGYTSAQIMDIFRDNGAESGLVSLGGNVQLFGTKPDGSLWKVGIQDPYDESGHLGVLEAADVAIITSGGYERFFEQDGVTYHHIIDPRTGFPADSGVVSSTIVSADGTLADGLSTALYIMGVEDAIRYWKQYGENFDFILLDKDGVLWVTEGIAESFRSDSYEVQIVR